MRLISHSFRLNSLNISTTLLTGMMSRARRALQNPELAVKHVKRLTIEPLNRRAGSAIFNRPISATNVMSGRLAIMRAQARSGELETEREYSRQLQKDQYVELGQPWNQEIIYDIREDYLARIEDDEYSVVLGEHGGETYMRSLTSWDSRFDLFEEIPGIVSLLDERIRSIIRGYYDAHFRPIRVQGYRTYHIPPAVRGETEIFSDYWHCDDHTIDHLKLFVYLSDVTEDDGPLHVTTMSDTDRLVDGRFERGEDGVPNGRVENEGAVKRFIGPVGSAAFGNTQLILHRAGNPSPERPRDMLMFQFAPSSVPVTDDWPEQCKRDIVDGFQRLIRY